MDSVSKLYEELISFSDLYDSASFEAKKMIVNQFIRRVDVYRGYQLNITFNFDLTPYIERDDAAACWKNRRQTFLFENGVKSKVGGCIGTACKSLKTVQAKQCSPKNRLQQKEKHHTSYEVQCFLYGDYRDRTGDLLHAMQALSQLS